MGIYRTAFINIDQTEPLMLRKVTVPVVALGGEKGLGAKVGEMVKMVAETVEAHDRPDHARKQKMTDTPKHHFTAESRDPGR
jgi:hypothetical protein